MKEPNLTEHRADWQAASGAIVEVLVPLPFDHGFDYRVPEGATVRAGDYVSVPFGKRELIGVVWRLPEAGETKIPIKEIRSVSDGAPMSPVMRKFIDWVAQYTLSPLGMVLKMSLSVPEALVPPKRKMKERAKAENETPQLPALSEAQRLAAGLLAQGLGAFSVTLLDGVTGSGKTEVYFDTVAAALAKGQQALVLLPEIALSAQWLARFRKRFGFTPVVWHSAVGKAEKKRAWQQVRDGTAPVVVGARSALFLPFASLGLIVVDEEHDQSYKQEDGVIYQARDMAVVRAMEEKIPIILASATPSLETWVNAQAGRYRKVHLPARYRERKMPHIAPIDLRSEAPERGLWIAPRLRDEIVQRLEKGEQSLLFLNRRGYAPLLLCRACGHRFECPHCTAWLVLHRRLHIVQCHHCGYLEPEPHVCPACKQSHSLSPCGPGVERVAEEARALFPSARIATMASDLIHTPAEGAALVEAMEKGEIDILVGTQMTAKGHHFPLLTLVGVIDADLGLAGGDLRASERTYQLLHQVAGRTGRAESPGLALLQTTMPGHPVMAALRREDRDAFLDAEAEERRLAGMPPYGRLAALIVSAESEDAAERAARDLAKAAPPLPREITLLGPAPAPLFMLRNQYRHRFLLKAPREVRLQSYISTWLEAAKLPRTIKVKVDIDPYSFL